MGHECRAYGDLDHPRLGREAWLLGFQGDWVCSGAQGVDVGVPLASRLLPALWGSYRTHRRLARVGRVTAGDGSGLLTRSGPARCA